MMASNSLWLTRRQRRPDAHVRLYCFPHSGGSAGEYMRWLEGIPEIEVWGVQLPGRGRRLAETPPRTMAELLAALMSEVDFKGPFAFFGHSLGALVAYETALALRELGRPGPQRLLLSAYGAPHLHEPGEPIHLLDDDGLLAAIAAEYGPLPPELADPEFRELTLVPLRADLSIVASYQHRQAAPLDCPISIVGGDSDHPTVDRQVDWAEYTSAEFDLRVFPGDHFYYREQPDAVLNHLSDKLAQRAVSRPDSMGSPAAVPF